MTTLRTRLLLSYGLLIFVLLSLFSLGALVGLLRNPLVYQDAAQQLRNAQRAAFTNAETLASLASNPDPDLLEQVAERLNVRIVLLNSGGAILADSQSGSATLLPNQPLRLKLLAQRNEIAFLRDESKYLWLVLAQPVDSRTYLVLAVRRPRMVFLEVLRSELVRPAALTGFIGLVFAMLITLWLAHWIAAPLKRISKAAESVADGQYQTIPLSGPVEVRHLVNSFNLMVRRVQDALQSQRDLVANVSHELKTPLTSIQGFTQAILDGVIQTPEETRQAAQVIFDESNRMNRLAQDLVTLARLEGETNHSQFKPLDISKLAYSVADLFNPQAAQAGVRLDLDALDVPEVMGDDDQLVQVISNLLDNAIKYTPHGGSVRLSVCSRGSNVEMRVTDTGTGIHPDDRERIFQRFYRADRSKPGTGLGLAITRQIVLTHGGTIRVADNPPQGSVFIVLLPAADND